MGRPLIFGLIAAAASGSGPLHQQAAEHGRDLVRVDLRVVTEGGEPVTDLKPEEVSIRLGGRTRTVRSLQLVSVAQAGGGLPAPFGTNVSTGEPRDIALIIDDESFRAGREGPLREAVHGLVAGLAQGDRVSLINVPYGGMKVAPTTDHSRISAAITRIVGNAPEAQTGSELACRTRRTLEALLGHLQSLGYRESPATIVFFTAGLAGPRRDAPMTMAPGMCELPADLFRQIGVLAAGARARFYVVPPVDVTNTGTVMRENVAGAEFRGSDNPLEGIEHLAGVTGGKLLAISGASGGALARILRETSAYYVAGVEPRDDDRTGRPMPVDVKIARPGVEVRIAPQIAFPKPERVAPSRPANPSPREMLGVMTVFRDLPLRATAFSSLNDDGKTVRVTTIAEPAEPGVKLTSLVAALFDREGKAVANWVASDTELARPTVIGAMAVEPGAYRLRVAAIDATGRSGTADYDVLAELVQTGPLRLSSLVLGLSRDGAFVPRLEFSNEPVAIGFLELYGGAPGLGVSATLELARTLNGPALLTVPLSFAAGADGRYTARAAIPLGALAPGDYAVRAIVGVDGQAPTRVVHTLRKRPITP